MNTFSIHIGDRGHMHIQYEDADAGLVIDSLMQFCDLVRHLRDLDTRKDDQRDEGPYR